ncbi:unnamed protein product [Caenorhabditis bovis]|uniref:Uncharacterized protein n=1 Tax=Caenorhabditis bovis TaxID=2654633 RepID=A0A8S1EH56_9PELO|nr:unnamed protein product [Caenorhabditis bovis]
MSSEPSTSTEAKSLEEERAVLLQQALSQAGVNRAQKLKNGANQKRKADEAHVAAIKEHPLLPIVQLLFLKCEMAEQTFDKKYFEMDDVVKVRLLFGSVFWQGFIEAKQYDYLIEIGRRGHKGGGRQ